MKLSKRLLAVADMCNKGNVVADIGTDHGYLPIYLVLEKIAPKVIAMDVRSGPLQQARQNIKQFCAETMVETRLSDGLNELFPKEAGTVTICGMGSRLIQNIIINGIEKISNDTQLIFSPQSEIRAFREFLNNNGFITLKENMIEDEGKYYCIMDCRYTGKGERKLTETELRYGKYLLDNKNEVLGQFLIREKEAAINIIKDLKENNYSESVQRRINEFSEKIAVIENALEIFNK